MQKLTSVNSFLMASDRNRMILSSNTHAHLSLSHMHITVNVAVIIVTADELGISSHLGSFYVHP